MTISISRQTGIISAGGVDIGFGVAASHLQRQGLALLLEKDVGNGWTQLSSGPFIAVGRQWYMTLYCYNDDVGHVRAFARREHEASVEEIKVLHDKILHDCFGEPSRQSEQETLYIFPWGSISSFFDPKGWSSAIVLKWA